MTLVADPAPVRAQRDGQLTACAVAAGVAMVVPDGLFAAVAGALFMIATARLLPVTDSFPVRSLVVLGMLLAAAPLAMLAAPALGGSGAARVAVAVTGTAAAVLAGRQRRTRESRPARAPRSHVFTWVGLGGVVLILNTYVLRGRSGLIGLMDHDHVFHAAVIASTWASELDPGAWRESSPADILGVPSALHWSAAIWASRALPDPESLLATDRVNLLGAIAACAICIGWLALVSAARVAATRLRPERAWIFVGLVGTLLGPVLWLRYQGMWPALVAAGYLALGAACAGSSSDAGDRAADAGRGPDWSLLVAGAICWVVALQAWPLLAVPVGLGVALWVAAAARRPIDPRLLRRRLLLAGVTLAGGVLWSLATTQRSVDSLAGGQGGLGLVDWRLGGLLCACVAVLASRPAEHLRAPAAAARAVLLLAALVGLGGVAYEYLLTELTGVGLTYYAGKMSLIAVAMAAAVGVMWLSTAIPRARGRARAAWIGLTSAAAAFAMTIWLPWGADFWPHGSVGVAPGVPALLTSIVADEALATQQAAADAPILRCGIDGVIRWPSPSTRTGAFKYAAMWSAVAAGRVDRSSWAAVADVLPPFSHGVTVGQQLDWFGMGGEMPRSIVWVVPDSDAYLLSEKVSSMRLDPGLRVRVLGATEFDARRAQCEAG